MLLLVTSSHLNAQKDTPPNERIKAMKIAFITDRVQLTAEEAEKFWPVYNEYSNKKDKTLEELKSLSRHFIKNKDEISDEELEEMLDKYIQLQKAESELLSSYHQKFEEILPAHKVMALYIAEVQFRNFLLQRIREHRGGQNHGRGR